jgi:hypothetical protein
LDQRPYVTSWHNLSAVTTIPLALLTKRRRGQNFSVEDIEFKVFGRSGSTARRSTCRNFPAASQLSLAPLMFNPGTPANSTKNR